MPISGDLIRLRHIDIHFTTAIYEMSLLTTWGTFSISNMLLANSDPSISRQQVAMGFLRFELEAFTKSPDKVCLKSFSSLQVARHQLTTAGNV